MDQEVLERLKGGRIIIQVWGTVEDTQGWPGGLGAGWTVDEHPKTHLDGEGGWVFPQRFNVVQNVNESVIEAPIGMQDIPYC